MKHLLLLAALAPASSAQSVLYTFEGDSAGDEFGGSVRCAGDVNGDGVPDLIVGALNDDNNGKSSGSARVFSGLDGSILYTFDGDAAWDRFGSSVSGAGDVNGDGRADLIVGAPRDDNNGFASGSARVFSGLNGSILYTFDGDSENDLFGTSVSAAGDVNGDGFADVIVGADLDDNNGDESGSARVFSGKDGSVLYTFDGDSEDDYFGRSVSGAGDVNGDGLDDLIVGAPGDKKERRGSAWVFSGADGSLLYTFFGTAPKAAFGYSVSGAGDVNGDGLADLIVGSPGDPKNGQSSGSARVFSGKDGSVTHKFEGEVLNDFLGFSVSAGGDVNGDGFDDVIVGTKGDDDNGADSGSARVFSGRDGRLLHVFSGESEFHAFGGSVSSAGDVNGDGFADLMVGAIWGGNNPPGAGNARVFSGCDLCGSIGQNYCGPANFNSTGQSAVIFAIGSPIAYDNVVTLTADRLPSNVFGYFLNSDVQGFTPFPPGSQGNLCLGGGIGRHVKQVANSGAAGQLVIDVDLTTLPRPGGTHSVVAGETWNFQCWFRDANPGPTSNFTDGIEIQFL